MKVCRPCAADAIRDESGHAGTYLNRMVQLQVDLQQMTQARDAVREAFAAYRMEDISGKAQEA